MKIIIDVRPEDIDWRNSKVYQFAERGPDDAIYWDVDVDIDQCYWNGKPIDFVDDNEAAQWFNEDYKEGQADTRTFLEDGGQAA